MLKVALESVIKDESFNLPIEPAATALQTAKVLLQWESAKADNKIIFKAQEDKILSELNTVIRASQSKSLPTKRMDMCRRYHELRTSDGFMSLWTELLLAANYKSPAPTLTQHLADLMFEALVAEAFKPSIEANQSISIPSHPEQPLTFEEYNVIRYAGGYVCRKLKEKIEKTTSMKNQQQALKCVMSFRLKEDDESDSKLGAASNWLNSVDRGGLWNVQDDVFVLFCALEEEVRQHYHMSKVYDMTPGYKQKVVEAILDNDTVKFHWSQVTAGIEETVSTILLDMIVDIWTTVRGFSFTNSFMELYKQHKKKNLQRSKALRKDIS